MIVQTNENSRPNLSYIISLFIQIWTLSITIGENMCALETFHKYDFTFSHETLSFFFWPSQVGTYMTTCYLLCPICAHSWCNCVDIFTCWYSHWHWVAVCICIWVLGGHFSHHLVDAPGFCEGHWI